MTGAAPRFGDTAVERYEWPFRLRLPFSSYVIQMLRYAVSLAVLAGLGRGARLPADLGTPFLREQR